MGTLVRYEIPEEGRKAYRPKHFEYSNEDEDNSPDTLSHKKY